MVVYTLKYFANLANQEVWRRPSIEFPTDTPANPPATNTISPTNHPTRLPTPPPASHGDENATHIPAGVSLRDPSPPTAAPAAISLDSIPTIPTPNEPPVISVAPSESTLDSAIEELAAAPVTPGAAFVSNTSVSSMPYKKKKARTIRELRDSLKKMSPKYDALLKDVKEVPTFLKQKKIETIFVMLSHQGDRRKKIQVLNGMLIDWVVEKQIKMVGFQHLQHSQTLHVYS